MMVQPLTILAPNTCSIDRRTSHLGKHCHCFQLLLLYTVSVDELKELLEIDIAEGSCVGPDSTGGRPVVLGM
jgi:hypothetical protein